MIGAAKLTMFFDFNEVLYPSLATADQYPAYIGAGCSLELSFETTFQASLLTGIRIAAPIPVGGVRCCKNTTAQT